MTRTGRQHATSGTLRRASDSICGVVACSLMVRSGGTPPRQVGNPLHAEHGVEGRGPHPGRPGRTEPGAGQAAQQQAHGDEGAPGSPVGGRGPGR
jgi:hypothetical protein